MENGCNIPHFECDNFGGALCFLHSSLKCKVGFMYFVDLWLKTNGAMEGAKLFLTSPLKARSFGECISSHEWIMYFQVSTNNLYIYTLIMWQWSKGVIALTHTINNCKHCSILCIHYEKSPLLKPHYPAIKTKK